MSTWWTPSGQNNHEGKGILKKINCTLLKYVKKKKLVQQTALLSYILHIPKIKQKIINTLRTHQIQLIRSNKKLLFYSSVKTTQGASVHLDLIKNWEHRQSVAKLRSGNHSVSKGYRPEARGYVIYSPRALPAYLNIRTLLI